MSQENVEIVRNAFEAFLREDIPPFLEALHPEVEWKQIEEPRPRYGHTGVGEAVAQWMDMFEDPKFEALEYIDGADGHVVVLVRMTGRGKGSGADVEMSSYHLFTVREGQIVRMHEFGPDKRAEALEAAGVGKRK